MTKGAVERLGQQRVLGPGAGWSDPAVDLGECCAVCGGSQQNPICGGTIKPDAPPVCFPT